jgi:hypothetical protein
MPAWAGELTQYFPAVPDGETAKRPESGWKIAWQVRQPKTHDYGGTAVWELQSVRFMKGYNADGSQDWVTVLNRLALAEMYVPYHEGRYFLDISGGQVVDGRFHPFHFHMVKARKDFFPSLSAVKPQLHDEYVISEVADDHVRWMDNRRRDMVRRGQALHLWATLNSGNYRYVLRYSFADDGSIGVRAGGTAENFFDLGPVGSGDHATHIHMAAWRMEFDLGNPDTNKLEMIERRIDANRQPFTDKRPFNKGHEGGEVWDPLKFSALKISSGQTQNRHQPPRNIAYILRPLRTGTVRTAFPFTQNDFWVTRLRPDLSLPRERIPRLDGNVDVDRQDDHHRQPLPLGVPLLVVHCPTVECVSADFCVQLVDHLVQPARHRIVGGECHRGQGLFGLMPGRVDQHPDPRPGPVLGGRHRTQLWGAGDGRFGDRHGLSREPV